MKTFEELKSFVAQKRLIKTELITPNTSIEDDLGLTGDDAIDFIENFSKRFNVDVSDFKYDKYFNSEGVSISAVLDFLFKIRHKKIKLRLQDLLLAIESGKLI